MSKKPNRIKNTFIARKYLYEYLSTTGPKISDPINMPSGSKEARIPLSISDKLYSADSLGNVAPRVINDIPNIKITTQEAANTSCLL